MKPKYFVLANIGLQILLIALFFAFGPSDGYDALLPYLLSAALVVLCTGIYFLLFIIQALRTKPGKFPYGLTSLATALFWVSVVVLAKVGSNVYDELSDRWDEKKEAELRDRNRQRQNKMFLELSRKHTDYRFLSRDDTYNSILYITPSGDTAKVVQVGTNRSRWMMTESFYIESKLELKDKPDSALFLTKGLEMIRIFLKDEAIAEIADLIKNDKVIFTGEAGAGVTAYCMSGSKELFRMYLSNGPDRVFVIITVPKSEPVVQEIFF